MLLLCALNLVQLLAHLRIAELEDAGVVRAGDLLLGAQGVLAEVFVFFLGGGIVGKFVDAVVLRAHQIPGLGRLFAQPVADRGQMLLLGLANVLKELLEEIDKL